jgi:hypothetical protein
MMRYQDRKCRRLPPCSGILAILAARRAYSTCQTRSSVHGGRARPLWMRVPPIASTAGSSVSVGTNPVVVSRLSRVRAARTGGAQNRVDRLVGGTDGHRLGDLASDRPARQIEGRHSRTSGPSQPILRYQGDPARHGAAHSHHTVKESLTRLPVAADEHRDGQAWQCTSSTTQLPGPNDRAFMAEWARVTRRGARCSTRRCAWSAPSACGV